MSLNYLFLLILRNLLNYKVLIILVNQNNQLNRVASIRGKIVIFHVS